MKGKKIHEKTKRTSHNDNSMKLKTSYSMRYAQVGVCIEPASCWVAAGGSVPCSRARQHEWIDPGSTHEPRLFVGFKPRMWRRVKVLWKEKKTDEEDEEGEEGDSQTTGGRSLDWVLDLNHPLFELQEMISAILGSLKNSLRKWFLTLSGSRVIFLILHNFFHLLRHLNMTSCVWHFKEQNNLISLWWGVIVLRLKCKEIILPSIWTFKFDFTFFIQISCENKPFLMWLNYLCLKRFNAKGFTQKV